MCIRDSSEIVREENLPEKLMLVHRFTEDMIERPDALESHPGVEITLNVDGFGTKAQKLAKYRVLVPRRFHAGFKLFYREDTGLMSPRELLRTRCPVEERVGGVAVQLDVGHEHMFASLGGGLQGPHS